MKCKRYKAVPFCLRSIRVLPYAIKQAADHDVKRYADLRESMKRYRLYGLNGHGDILTANQIGELFDHHRGHGNPAAVVSQTGVGIEKKKKTLE